MPGAARLLLSEAAAGVSLSGKRSGLLAGRCSLPSGPSGSWAVCGGLSSAGGPTHLVPPHVYIALWFPFDVGDPVVTEEIVEPQQSCLLSYSELKQRNRGSGEATVQI